MELHRPLSALLAAAYLAGAWVEAGPAAAGLLAVPLALLVWLVWDAEIRRDVHRGTSVSRPSGGRRLPDSCGSWPGSSCSCRSPGIALSWRRSAS